MLQIKFECSKDFTCPFDLEDMGEIDLKIEIDEQMKKDIEKKNEKIEREIQKLKKLEKEKKLRKTMQTQNDLCFLIYNKYIEYNNINIL